jgi:hypothetical protein
MQFVREKLRLAPDPEVGKQMKNATFAAVMQRIAERRLPV